MNKQGGEGVMRPVLARPVLAIDPGSEKSGYVCWGPSGFCSPTVGSKVQYPPFGKVDNRKIEAIIALSMWDVVIEKITLYQKADQNIHATIWWYGRFSHVSDVRFSRNVVAYLTRTEVKKRLLPGLPTGQRNDTTIKAYLKDRFAPGVRNHGKGTKAEPGYFYGFHRDVWQAFALAVAYHDGIGEVTAA